MVIRRLAESVNVCLIRNSVILVGRSLFPWEIFSLMSYMKQWQYNKICCHVVVGNKGIKYTDWE